MSNEIDIYAMPASELNSFLAEQRENGFVSLSQKKRLFALEFIQSGSYLEAATAAEIEAPQAKRWLKDPLVSAFINYLNQQKEHYSLIDASFVEVQYLTLFTKLIGEEEVPLVDKDGIAYSAKKFHSSDAVACLRDLAKVSGHFKEDPAVRVQVEGLLTEEQRAILNQKLDEHF